MLNDRKIRAGLSESPSQIRDRSNIFLALTWSIELSVVLGDPALVYPDFSDISLFRIGSGSSVIFPVVFRNPPLIYSNVSNVMLLVIWTTGRTKISFDVVLLYLAFIVTDLADIAMRACRKTKSYATSSHSVDRLFTVTYILLLFLFWVEEVLFRFFSRQFLFGRCSS